jgi:hypothetical protein
MAAIDFPNSPTVGDLFTAGNSSYRWTGEAWVSNNLGSINWVDIEDKPTEFPPSAHVHDIEDVTGLQDALDDKSDVGHTHLLADITDYTPPVIPEVTFTNTLMLMGA